MNFKKFEESLKYKKYNKWKIFIRFIEFKLKDIAIDLIINFNLFKIKSKPMIDLGSFKDNRFINYLLYSLKNDFIFVYKKDENTKKLFKRIGLVNFSVVGRNCTQEQRNEYYKWDQIHQERKEFVEEICGRYGWLDASIGGEISIDIHEKGADKGQILDDLNGENFTFFGDNLVPGGNDYAIKEATIRKKLKGNEFYHVESWKDTRDLLYSIMTEGII